MDVEASLRRRTDCRITLCCVGVAVYVLRYLIRRKSANSLNFKEGVDRVLLPMSTLAKIQDYSCQTAAYYSGLAAASTVTKYRKKSPHWDKMRLKPNFCSAMPRSPGTLEAQWPILLHHCFGANLESNDLLMENFTEFMYLKYGDCSDEFITETFQNWSPEEEAGRLHQATEVLQLGVYFCYLLDMAINVWNYSNLAHIIIHTHYFKQWYR